MELAQLRILYRKFLFRMIDLELISSQSDMSKLLGQFAALLIFLSLIFMILPAWSRGPQSAGYLTFAWSMEHFLIATTMLAVGLFAVVSWNSTFLDQRDVLVLSPLPIRARTLFFGKIAAVATALLMVVGFMNVFPSLTWTLTIASHPAMSSTPAFTSDPALPPVDLEQLKSLLDRDMAELAPVTAAIGVLKHGTRSTLAYGDATPGTTFEIGALAKTFTSPELPERLGMADTTRSTEGARSNVADMLTFLDANLHPEKFPAVSATLRDSQVLRGIVAPAWTIGRTPQQKARAWGFDMETESYWLDGSPRGPGSLAFFNPKHDYAAVVLVNRSGNLAGRIGMRIHQRLAGLPAVSLSDISIPEIRGSWALLRWFGAFWVTVIASGAFIFGCVLSLQGLAAQLLPRWLFLRASSFLQLAAFCVLVLVYFLQPIFTTQPALIAAQQDGLMGWSPSYWFLGLFQSLTGSPALGLLARRAWIAIIAAGGTTVVVYAVSYFRTLRKIAEEPDIVPSRQGVVSLPSFGNPFQTAIIQFSIRTLFRSRQHRVLLAFYLAIGFALTIVFLKTPQGDASIPLMASSILMMASCLMGLRAVISIPVDLAANWVFRVTPGEKGNSYLTARRRTLLLAVGVLWLGWAAVLFWNWSLWPAVGHLIVLGLIGLILTEAALFGIQKIPFTCSYQPGKSNFHMSFWAWVAFALGLFRRGVAFERQALQDIPIFAAMVTVLSAIAVIARRRTTNALESKRVEFEDQPEPALNVLNLHEDGVPVIIPHAAGLVDRS